MDLVADLKTRGYHVYCDNYYTSPNLCDLLFADGFGCCGTVRLNRKRIPPQFGKKKLNQGEVTHYKNGNILGIKWQDKRCVSLLTTIHDASMTRITRRSRRATGGVQDIYKPTAIDKYNHFMGGVDRADQLVTYYGFCHFTKKWWKRIFFHLLDTTIVNAYILYKQAHPNNNLSHLDFRICIAEALLLEQPAFTVGTSRPTSVDTPIRLMNVGQHFPEPSSRRRCKVCDKRPVFKCGSCDVTLCVHPCFKKYHTLKKYK